MRTVRRLFYVDIVSAVVFVALAFLALFFFIDFVDEMGARRLRLAAPWLIASHLQGGRLPWYLPAGGSNPVGALGYVEGALEIAAQVAAGGAVEIQ